MTTPAKSVPGEPVTSAPGERADLLAALAKSRYFLRYTLRGLTDEQAAQRTTVSELCLGGLIKHVAANERQWCRFMLEGPSAMGNWEDEGGVDVLQSGCGVREVHTVPTRLAAY